MNTSFVIRELGRLLTILSAFLAAVAGWATWMIWSGGQAGDQQGIVTDPASARALAMTAVAGFILGGGMFLAARRAKPILTTREAMLLVALSWLVGAALAAIPYFLWALTSPIAPTDHAFHSFAACYFEAMSGLTTTGATTLSDIESMPRGLLMWRSLTQWLGGLGIVVLFVAVLPMLGVGGKKIFQVEAPGPTPQGVRPRIGETARVLWLIYVGMTIVLTLLLWLFGMSWFDAVNHTLTALATGGFSTRNASIAHYDSWAIDLTLIVFMLLAGVNFGLYYQAMRGRFKTIWRDPELRLYLTIILGASMIVIAALAEERIVSSTGITTEPSFAAAVRYGLFQVVAIQTTTGYITADFDQWGFFPKAVLMALMFVGGSAGSTGGGIKVIRILIVFKVLFAELDRVFRPNVVQSIKVGKSPIDPELRLATVTYILTVLVVFLLGTILLVICEGSEHIDLTTAATASITTLNNVGPGLARVGAIQNFGWFSAPSHVVMSLLMVLGRLELYAILVLLRPRFWQGE